MKKILIIDDNDLNFKILELILSKTKYKVDAIINPKYALDAIIADPPDLILLDISMPEIDGFKLCSMIKHNEKIKNIPIIFVTVHASPEFIVRGFEYGAVDYITKPFNAEEIKARVATHLKMQELQNKLFAVNENLEKMVHEQVIKISDAQMETIYSLAKLAQSRDDNTGHHLERIRRYCYILASRLSKKIAYAAVINDKFIKNIFNASPLHDIGKVGIPDSVLLSPGELLPKEFEMMKRHTIIGYETLSEVHSKFGDNRFIEMGKTIARSHHERWDGKGYPDGLSGEGIPLAARIVAVADVYDTLTSKRSYKDPLTHNEAMQEICKVRGTQFDPKIVDVFMEASNEFLMILTGNNEELVG